MDSRRHLLNSITILTDSRRIERIAITCRCGNRWVEPIPGELHDSQLTCEFTCIKCSTKYHLQNKRLHRATEDNDVRFDKATIDTSSKQQFDA